MRSVKDILKKKGGEAVTMAPTDTVYAMLELMAKLNIGSVLVMDGKELVGVVSERDYARNVVLQGRASKDAQLHEIMAGPVVVVSLHDRMNRCMGLMTQHRVRHLPVVEDGKVCGVVSIGDVVKEIMMEQESLIADLEGYIGPHPETHVDH